MGRSVNVGSQAGKRRVMRILAVASTVIWGGSGLAWSQTSGEITYTKDIAPILQRSCETCHRADGAAPMSLTHLRRGPAVGAVHQAANRHRAAGRRDAAVVHGEEHRHPEVPRRSVAERRRRSRRSRSGPTAARRTAILPTCRRRGSGATPTKWAIGEPDLIVKTAELTVKANSPDWWGEIPRVPIPLTEDRYVVALADQGSERRRRQGLGTCKRSAAATSSIT